MLRRPPTIITLTAEDVAAYSKAQAARAATSSAEGTTTQSDDQNNAIDPNDELRPLPGDKARIVRTREERIGVSMGTRS